MNVLDLCSGLGGWSQAFAARGHDVTTVDYDSKFNPTIAEDVLQLTSDHLATRDGKPWDFILSGPPCEKFSVASMGRYWTASGEPNSDEARHAIAIVKQCRDLAEALQPRGGSSSRTRAACFVSSRSSQTCPAPR